MFQSSPHLTKVLRSTHYLNVVTFQNFSHNIINIHILQFLGNDSVILTRMAASFSLLVFDKHALKKNNNQNYDYLYKYLTMHIKTIFEYLVNDFLALEDNFFLTF